MIRKAVPDGVPMLPLCEGLIGVLNRASALQAVETLALGAAYVDGGYVASTELASPYAWRAHTCEVVKV